MEKSEMKFLKKVLRNKTPIGKVVVKGKVFKVFRYPVEEAYKEAMRVDDYQLIGSR